jgi:1-phosphatidylinositol-4-phosphate 5-kinase
MISAVAPKEYGDRFLAFIRSCIRGNDESLRPKMFEKESEQKELEKQAPPPNVSEDDEKVQQRAQEGQEEGANGHAEEERRRKEQ